MGNMRKKQYWGVWSFVIQLAYMILVMYKTSENSLWVQFHLDLSCFEADCSYSSSNWFHTARSLIIRFSIRTFASYSLMRRSASSEPPMTIKPIWMNLSIWLLADYSLIYHNLTHTLNWIVNPLYIGERAYPAPPNAAANKPHYGITINKHPEKMVTKTHEESITFAPPTAAPFPASQAAAFASSFLNPPVWCILNLLFAFVFLQNEVEPEWSQDFKSRGLWLERHYSWSRLGSFRSIVRPI